MNTPSKKSQPDTAKKPPSKGVAPTNGKQRIPAGNEDKKRPANVGLVIMLSPLPLEHIPSFVLLWLDYLRELLAPSMMSLEIETRPECFGPKPGPALSRLTSERQSGVWLLFHSTREMQNWFVDQKLPHLVLGSAFDTSHSPSVDLDQFAVGRHAAATFAKLGHKRVAVVIPQDELAGDCAMIEGVMAGKTSTSDAPLEIDLLKHDGSPNSILKCVDKLLGLDPRPTGILSGGGMQTVTIITRLLEQGIKIPKDVSVISRDDDPVLNFTNPPPARYHREPRKFARCVFEQIDWIISKCKSAPQVSRIFPALLPESTLSEPPKSKG